MVFHDFVEDPVNPLAVPYTSCDMRRSSRRRRARTTECQIVQHNVFNVNEHGVHACPLSRTYWFMSEAPWLELKVNQVRRC